LGYQNEGESADFANFDHKLIAMATCLEHQEKGVRSVIFNQMPIIYWKLGENWSSSSWGSFAWRFLL